MIRRHCSWSVASSAFVVICVAFTESKVITRPNVQCGMQLVRKSRILGGAEAYAGEFPFLVSLHKDSVPHSIHCGGAILSQRWILTAAHCVSRFQRSNPPLLVRLRRYDTSRRNANGSSYIDIGVAEVLTHPSFLLRTYNSDIALLRLKREIVYDSYSWPVCLPATATQMVGREATVAGWGLTNEGLEATNLQKLTLPIIESRLCEEMYNIARPNINMHLQHSQMCAGYKEGKRDTCWGDSGGPLFIKENNKFTVIGLVSAGIACGLPLLPGIYTNVGMFVPWILDNIRGS